MLILLGWRSGGGVRCRMRWVSWFGGRLAVVSVVMEPELELLLRQTAADLDVPPEEVARVMLESALLGSLAR